MKKEWKLQGLLTKRWETKRGLSAQCNTKLSPLPLLSPRNPSITKHILPSCFYSFFHTPSPTLSLPQKEPAWPPTYTLQAQCHSESSTRSSPFSCCHPHIFYSRFPSVTYQYNVVREGAVLPTISTCECTGGLIFSNWRGETTDCVYAVCSFQNKKMFMWHADPWGGSGWE